MLSPSVSLRTLIPLVEKELIVISEGFPWEVNLVELKSLGETSRYWTSAVGWYI